MAPVLALGLGAWRLLHLAALLLLPRWLAALMLVLGPFWYDLAHGNVMTFIVVLAWHALGGKVWAQTAYFGMAMLFPRPLMLPVGAWLLWKHPQSRLPAAAVCIAGLGATAATGELPSWIAALSRGGDVIGAAFDWGPSRFLGPWWIPIGLVVGGWLTIRGRLGWASLLVSPYILPYYFLMVLLELRRFTGPSAESEDERDPRLPKLVRG
jgi:hypothetical protein